MLWKFIPYMLATKVGGMPTTEAMVRTLNSSFCSVLMKPSCRIQQELHLVGEMDFIIVERLDVAARHFQPRLDRLLQPAIAMLGDEGHGALQHQQRVADMGQPLAHVADLHQGVAQHAVGAADVALAAARISLWKMRLEMASASARNSSSRSAP